MKIDSSVEVPLRRTFVAVIDHDADGILSPLEPLDESKIGLAGGYAALVVQFVMNHVFENDVDAEAADVIAEKLVPRVSEWTEIGTKEQVSAFALACATGDGAFTGVPQDNVSILSFIVAGYLLAWYTPEGMRWFEYLDQIWKYYESQPDPA